ncbi:MAG: NBR1-Ig-like domain-containing protein [Brevefilum sp.]
MRPGETFSKTWRLENTGSCTWTRLYSVTFFSGNSLSAIQTNTLPEPVKPGEQIDVTVDMEAPMTPGVYQSNWMLENEDGILFGIGPNGDAPFWVKIEVVPAVTQSPQPTATVTSTPVVYLSGEGFLDGGDQSDLDSGELNSGDITTADFVYQTGEDPDHILLTMNGTQWVFYGEDEPSYGDCTSTEKSGNALSFNDLPEENYVCYLTSNGLPGWFRIVGIEEDETLLIRFLTWSASEE